MSKFKPGDKVTPISAERYTEFNIELMRQLVGETLVVGSAYYDDCYSIVFAGLVGEKEWPWHPDDLRLVSAGELTPFQIACDLYNPGDRIIILSADPTYSICQREMVGTVQTVLMISSRTKQPIHAEITGGLSSWGWMPHEVRLATPEEIAADQKVRGTVPDQFGQQTD